MMTREEAISEISSLKDYMKYERIGSDMVPEALEMAIEALKQPEIIRCKNCEHAKSVNSRWICCDLSGRYELHDWYCASGRGKNNETN